MRHKKVNILLFVALFFIIGYIRKYYSSKGIGCGNNPSRNYQALFVKNVDTSSLDDNSILINKGEITATDDVRHEESVQAPIVKTTEMHYTEHFTETTTAPTTLKITKHVSSKDKPKALVDSSHNTATRVDKNVEVPLSEQRRKLILIADAFYSTKIRPVIPKDYNFTNIDGSLCPINHCEITYDKHKINTSDAVYFDAREVMKFDMKALVELREISDSQIWIWMMHENPIFTYYNVSDYDGFFNWSATYRPSSDVYIPYFAIKPLKGNEARPLADQNYALGKNKKVLVIISHCLDYRIDFIKQLKKYISVDLYGACKDLINPGLPHCHRGSEECKNIIKQYKFYLAIENFYCKDYVTEKYYLNSLLWNLVPIVLNGGNYSNNNVFINDTYINIEDFPTMKALGKFLNYVDENDLVYNSYHQWKYTYKVGLNHGMCGVCKALWDNDKQLEKKTLCLSEFWGKNVSCRSYKEKRFQNYLL